MSAAQQIQVRNVSCHFNDTDQTLFEDLTFNVGSGLQCLVGRNGSGKSILAAILAGEIEPSSGNVVTTGKVGYLSQGIVPSAKSVAELLGIDKLQAAWERIKTGDCNEVDFETMEGNWDFEQRIQQSLSVFGFEGDILNTPLREFSGGEQTKLRLVQLTLAQCDTLILDEPSNHLDQVSRRQLLEWLKSQSCVLLVTHERQLLAAADIIYELELGKLYRAQGNWDVYQATRQQRLQELSNKEQKASKALQSAKRKQIESAEQQAKQLKKGASNRKQANQSKIILDKAKETAEGTQGAKARQAQQAVSNHSRDLQEIKAQKALIDPLHFHVAPPRKTSGVVIQVQDVVLPYVTHPAISFQLQAGEKLALTGPNGCGKSTLLKIINSDIQPVTGSVNCASEIRYLDQHFSLLEVNQTALENFQRLSPGFTETEYRTILAHVRLRRDKALFPIAHLSGGERLKVALACLFFGRYSPDALLLDEPDNHLDIESKTLLEQTLESYKGALVLVSHDPVFLTRSGALQNFSL